MDVKEVLRKGLLQSTPKYLPVWFRYDKDGSVFNDRCLELNYYYLYAAELSVLDSEIQVIFLFCYFSLLLVSCATLTDRVDPDKRLFLFVTTE